MRVLVVGGAGFFGSHVVDRLLGDGHTVDVVDDLSAGSLANLGEARSLAAPGQLKFHHLDVQADELDELVARREPQVVVHLAALPRLASRSSSARSASAAPSNLLDACHRNGVEKVVMTLPGRHLYGDVRPHAICR
ncbi:MAG: NAD-dependent epimerase/dehydratase family protein [Ilumatobacteraceae bacterium]